VEIKSSKFIKSAANPSQCDVPSMPEIAVIGRSNVGKSTLINNLTNNRKLCRTSSTPGKTRLVNYFLINEEFYFVDLPGYGYAKVSKSEQEKWGEMVEGYFINSPNLVHIFLLMDIRRELNDNDLQMAWWSQHYNVPVTIIATKVDKITKSKRKQIADKLSDKLKMTFRTFTIMYSTLAKVGKLEVLDRIEDILANIVMVEEETEIE